MSIPFRVGHGYDLHRLEAGDKLILAGVHVPADVSPVAFSDGDVVLHAVVDALLGAMGWGDIGQWFPNTDHRWKDADSRVFVQTVYAKVKSEGFAVVNLDVTILAERPRLLAFRPAMVKNLTDLLGGVANIKAGTNEGCDSIGRGEAIAAHAVVLLAKEAPNVGYLSMHPRDASRSCLIDYTCTSMTLRVYNTLSQTKELFEPVRPGRVGMYLCGPTVYKSPHIGHMVGPVIFDAIKRYLSYKGYDVTWVVNITDVDDKLIEAAARRQTTVAALAAQCTREYMECLSMLGIESIDKFPRASEHMPEIIDLCAKLISGGHAYAAQGNVWFDVTSDPDYGKLSHRNVAEQESGTRSLESTGKRNAADFALWKASKPGEPEWESPWGVGRPGWHIECSAMSMKYLGTTLDIHGGGMDLLFPHHENELAQSESVTGKPFVKFWLHNGLTKVRTKGAAGQWQSADMHASSGNAVSAKELIERHGPELFRYMLLCSHYRRPIDFADDVVGAAGKGLATFTRLEERVSRLTGRVIDDTQEDMDGIAGKFLESEIAVFVREIVAAKMKFLEMMDDDFNTAGAIAVLHEIAGSVNAFLEHNKADSQRQPDIVEAAAAAFATIRGLGRVLGLFRHAERAGADDAARQDIGKLLALYIELRNEARQAKNFALADRIRDGLKERGYVLEDRAGGTEWRKF